MDHTMLVQVVKPPHASDKYIPGPLRGKGLDHSPLRKKRPVFDVLLEWCEIQWVQKRRRME